MNTSDYSKPFLFQGEWFKPEKDKKGNCKNCAFKGVVKCIEDLPEEMTEYCFWHCVIYKKI